jgi:hypothetical protein
LSRCALRFGHNVREQRAAVGRRLVRVLENAVFALVTVGRRLVRVLGNAALALVAAAVFALLDVLAPSVGATARQGAGFGLGANLVGFPMRR